MKSGILQLKTAMLLLAVLCLSVNGLFAQELTDASALSLVKKNASLIGLTKTNLENVRISAAYIDKTSGATLVYAQQTYKGVDVFNSIQTYSFKNGRLFSKAGSPIDNIADIANSKTGKPSVTPANAVSAVASHLRLAAAFAVAKQITDKEFDFGNMNVSSVNVISKLCWLPDEDNRNAVLTWQVEIQPKGSSDYWLVNVDALKGQVISKLNLTVKCKWNGPKLNAVDADQLEWDNVDAAIEDEPESAEAISSAKYKVIPFPAESPLHPGGTPAVKSNPWSLAGSGNDATTLKWNDDGTTSYDSSRGNNVLAQEDANGNNGFGIGAHSSTAVPDLTFNYTPNFSSAPSVAANQQFAITNLFYWNNIMHDISYRYGFDEVSGNFQKNNLGRGGKANDFVLADAQDGSGTDNANFATPKDGSSPRMQMFLWSANAVVNVTRPDAIKGKKANKESAFSTANKLSDVGPVQGRVILYADDAGNTTHLGCGAAANPAQLNGKIALIYRGNCGFTDKVKNAQNAGAIAVIMVDNIPGEYPITMGGTDNTITIPAVMVSYETGEEMRQNIEAGTIVSAKLSAGVQIDGDLDNGVVAHEYTHGISNRLTGGPNNAGCLSNKEQMGEGWSDYMALMVTTNWKTATVADSSKSRPIGTYAFGQTPDGPGIRYYPYSIDLNVNPWTYDSLKLSSRIPNGILTYDSHVVGEVWCNMLWNMTWAIIKDKGIGTNIYNAGSKLGNQVALQLVIEGMKLQPCSPGFVDGRNAILKADTLLYGAAHSATIWKAFASRGLGYNASQGSTGSLKDGVADYSLPPSLFAKTVQPQADAVAAKVLTSSISLSPNPANKKVTLTIAGNKQSLKVSLLSENGQVLRSLNMTGQILEINLPKLASGIYYVKITGDNFSETRKILVNQQ